MSFLTDDDFDVQTSEELRRVLLASKITQDTAENMATEQMSDYFRVRGYDIPAIFSATGANRNPMVIMYMIDLVLYHLSSKTPGRNVSETRQKRFDAAVEWLDKVSLNRLHPNLPTVPNTDTVDSTPTIKLGTNQKYSRRW